MNATTLASFLYLVHPTLLPRLGPLYFLLPLPGPYFLGTSEEPFLLIAGHPFQWPLLRGHSLTSQMLSTSSHSLLYFPQSSSTKRPCYLLTYLLGHYLSPSQGKHSSDLLTGSISSPKFKFHLPPQPICCCLLSEILCSYFFYFVQSA